MAKSDALKKEKLQLNLAEMDWKLWKKKFRVERDVRKQEKGEGLVGKEEEGKGFAGKKASFPANPSPHINPPFFKKKGGLMCGERRKG